MADLEQVDASYSMELVENSLRNLEADSSNTLYRGPLKCE